MKRSLHQMARGMTYIEIVVAILAVAVIAPGLGGTMMSITRDAGLGRELAQASVVLQSTADAVIATRRASLAGFGNVVVGTSTSNVTVGGKVFLVTTVGANGTPNVNGCPNTAPATDCKQVTITVATPTSGATVQTILMLQKYD